jgi:Helix-turn-helix domain
MSEISIDAIVDQKIDSRVSEKLPGVVAQELKHLKQPSVWMTEIELAEYLRLYKDGELTTSSIRKWTNRKENPLPCGNAGTKRRYHRDEVDAWVRAEAIRQKENNEKLKGRNGLHAVEKQAS